MVRRTILINTEMTSMVDNNDDNNTDDNNGDYDGIYTGNVVEFDAQK